jgi:hypothetical protein
VDQLARVAEAATDGDYIAELAKMNVAPDGTRLVPGLQEINPCKGCDHFDGNECNYDDGDCVILE